MRHKLHVSQFQQLFAPLTNNHYLCTPENQKKYDVRRFDRQTGH